jgi:4'-phosphopantetheinyl transferase
MLAFTRFDAATSTVPIAIAAGDLHVWGFALDESEATVEAWRKLLSADERLRADRFVFRRDRNRWIVGRGVLRNLLARYCGIDAAAIAFHYASAGKPSLACGTARGELVAFNLAHSHDRALLAVAGGREIGVDLERARDDFDPLLIAQRFFFGAELEAIEATAPALQRDAFFRHWVAKEAVLKANGAGLSLALDSFGVTFDSDGLAARVHASDPAVLDQALVVRMLPLAAGWHGAVAASGDGWMLRFPA